MAVQWNGLLLRRDDVPNGEAIADADGGVGDLVLAQALRMLPLRARSYGVAGVVGGLLVLQLTGLALMLDRFYA